MNCEPIVDSHYEEILTILDLFYYQNYSTKKIRTVSSELEMEPRKFRKRIEELEFEIFKNDLPITIQLSTTNITIEFSADYFRATICVVFMKQSFGFQLLDYLFQKEFKTIQILSEALHVSKSTIFRQLAVLNDWLRRFGLKIDFSKYGPLQGSELALRHFYQQLYEVSADTAANYWPFPTISHLQVKAMARQLLDDLPSQTTKKSVEIFIGILWQRKRKGFILTKDDLKQEITSKDFFMYAEWAEVFAIIFPNNQKKCYFEMLYFDFYFKELAGFSYPVKDNYSKLWLEKDYLLTTKYLELLENQNGFLVTKNWKRVLLQRVNFLVFLSENFFLQKIMFPMKMEIEYLKKNYPNQWKWNDYFQKMLSAMEETAFFQMLKREERTYYLTSLTMDLFAAPTIKILFDIKGYPLKGLKEELRKRVPLNVEFVESTQSFPDVLIINHYLDYYIPGCQAIFFNNTLSNTFWTVLNNLLFDIINTKLFQEKNEGVLKTK